jgi:hypothetical protein
MQLLRVSKRLVIDGGLASPPYEGQGTDSVGNHGFRNPV